MWFKNLLIYRFTKPFTLSPEQVEEKLHEHAFKPCGGQDMSTLGWVKPLGQQGSELVHTNNGCIMVCSQRQDKVLPASVIKDALEEKVLTIREDEDRVPSRKERLDIKEELVFDMLPRAFVKSRRQFAYIDPKNGWLVVDCGSHNRAEEMIVLLRESLGSMPVIPLAAKNTAYHTMTEWLKVAPPSGFELGGECELIDSADEAAVIRCKNQELTSKEILNHIDSGMLVKKLALSWSGG
ncbi:recombination-associated protein RdgC, partial [Litorivivens sp.]